MSYDTLTIRAYNVRFGDAFLISIPDERRPNDPPSTAGEPMDKIMRHILIDVGNSLSTQGGIDEVFELVVGHILEVLDGRPVDLYIMTHEHMDHIQGLLAAHKKHGMSIEARHAWLTASAAPDYYIRDWGEDDAPKKALQAQHGSMQAAYDELLDYVTGLQAAGETPPPLLMNILHINNYRTVKDCVDHLRERASQQNTAYMYRGYDNTGGDRDGPRSFEKSHPFVSTRLEVWAPEENTSVYYSPLRPLTLGFSEGEGDGPRQPTTPLPPAGVDASVFYRLVNARKNNLIENLLAIDKAKNNSSIVFSIEWAGWRFLFPGDAELKSWQVMEDKGMLGSPVHFLKISHHLSHNGTPDGETLDKIMPHNSPDGRKRLAVASTYPFTYSGIPFQDIVDRLEERGVQTFIIAKELGDIQDDEETPVEYVPGFLAFHYKDDGTDPLVERVLLNN